MKLGSCRAQTWKVIRALPLLSLVRSFLKTYQPMRMSVLAAAVGVLIRLPIMIRDLALIV